MIDAYVSPQVPTDYAAAKLNLLSTLEELKALGGGKIVVHKHEIPNYGPEAELAEKNFNIKPTRTGGDGVRDARPPRSSSWAWRFTLRTRQGRRPFPQQGNPRRVRTGPFDSYCFTSQTSATRRRRHRRPSHGSLGLDHARLAARSTELRKQYEVSSVNPTQPIPDTFDVLLVAQPSDVGTPGNGPSGRRRQDRHPDRPVRRSLPLLVPPAIGGRHRRAQDVSNGRHGRHVRRAAERAQGGHRTALAVVGHPHEPHPKSSIRTISPTSAWAAWPTSNGSSSTTGTPP